MVTATGLVPGNLDDGGLAHATRALMHDPLRLAAHRWLMLGDFRPNVPFLDPLGALPGRL